MSGERVFLRSDVCAEPLVDRFYASLLMAAPVPGAMNLAFLLVPLLESYLRSPRVHVNACRNPGLRGGFFVDVAEERAGEVADLLASIRAGRAGLLGLAAAVAAADELLRGEAAGFDLRPLYGRLPGELAGVCELVYDTANQASVRLLEPLLYAGGWCAPGRECVQLSVDDGSERPFVVSTPRLGGPGVVQLDVPFADPGLEVLFASRVRGADPARLAELGLDGGQLAALTGPGPDLAADRAVEAGARIRYFGHACVLLQTPGAAVLTDPWVSTASGAAGRYTFRDLPDWVDLALVTHGHADHLVLETLLALRGRVGAVVVPRSSGGTVCDPSPGLYLAHAGLPVTEVDDFSEVAFPGGKVTATPFLGEHADLDIRAKSTYVVEIGGRRVFIGADSSGIDPVLYRHIRSHTGPVDMAFLGMECAGAPLTWMYGALLTRPVTRKMAESRTLSGSDAGQAAAIMTELGAGEAYVYAMGEESWLGHIMATSYTPDSYQLKQVDAFMTWCAGHGIKAGHLYGQHEWRW
jgi:L-ascorbate metabolism protein UlaG (beta-lactamase superfamily)